MAPALPAPPVAAWRRPRAGRSLERMTTVAAAAIARRLEAVRAHQGSLRRRRRQPPTADAGRRTLPPRPARRHAAMTAADTDAEARTTLTVVSDFI